MAVDRPRELEDLPISVVGGHATIAKLAPGPAPQSLEARIEALELESAVHRLVASYAFFYDAKDFDALMDLYSDDATLINSSGTYVGRETVAAIHREDLPLTEISFHHLDNVVVSLGDGDGDETTWAAAYMYNLAIRDDEHYGTVATIVFALRRHGSGFLIAGCRIAIDSRHTLTSREMVLTSNPLATRSTTSAALVGTNPRYHL